MAETINTTTTEKQTTEASKVYTQEEVDKVVQAEADRRVNQAYEKWQRESQKKMSEAEKLAKMSESEKNNYLLSQKEQEIAAKEREIQMRENKLTVAKILAEKNLPIDLADLLVDTDAEVMNKKINLIETHIQEAVAAQMKSRIAAPTPKTSVAAPTEITTDQFRKMTYPEKLALQQSNPSLFKKLTGK